MSEVRCELCGTRRARYVCAICGKDACTDCFRLQLGICHKCAPG
jgi:hypothetical protein